MAPRGRRFRIGEDDRRRAAPPGAARVVQSMPARVVALQRVAGNRAVAAALGRHHVQRVAPARGGSPVVQRVELDVDYTVTGHGWDRINGRGISQTQLERTLDDPTVIHDDGNARIYVSAFGGGNVCIRAVMSKDHPMAVITVMKITGKKKVARYLDRP